MTPAAASPIATPAFIALIAGAGALGLGPIFVRVAEVGPVSSAFWRLALSVPLLLVLLRRETNGTGRASDGDARPRILLACGVFFAADIGLWHLSIARTSVANATLLANLNVIFVVLAGYFLFRERITARFFLALAVTMAGVTALMGASLQLAPERVPGDLLGLGAAVMYAAYLLAAKELRRRISAVRVLLWTAVITAALLLPVAALMGERILPVTAEGWLPLIGLGVICQVVGQGLIVYALAHLPANFSALTLLIQPVVAALLAWQLFGEALSPLELAGAGLILAGILGARLALRAG